jgi:UDP-N-acetylmuramate dehydrogenase
LTTYRLGGPAAWTAQPRSHAELDAVVAGADSRDAAILIVGRGSNLVVADAGFDGVVINFAGEFREFTLDGSVVDAGCAVTLPQLARGVVPSGLGGIEFFVGIPGTVGGAVAMNAGFLGTEACDVLIDATVLSLSTRSRRTIKNADLDFSYRHSAITSDDVVLSARFLLQPVEAEEALDRMRAVTRWRKEHQPGGTHNAGSVFKNPPGDHAGRLIDALGLKGLTVGMVSVSDRHANFFVAEADATAQDVYDLVLEVRRVVAERTGVYLEPEIRFAGSFRTAADAD